MRTIIAVLLTLLLMACSPEPTPTPAVMGINHAEADPRIPDLYLSDSTRPADAPISFDVFLSGFLP